MRGFAEEDETYTRIVIGHSVAAQDHSSWILGVMWDHVADAFRFNFTSLESHVSSMPITKRSVLRLTLQSNNLMSSFGGFALLIFNFLFYPNTYHILVFYVKTHQYLLFSFII